MENIEKLIAISQKYGRDSRYVIAGGGNTSFKSADKLWVKASGSSLATITESGFAVLDRAKLEVISKRNYSEDSTTREEEVKCDLADACITKDRRPSVETSLHNALSAPFIVHLHPTMVNGLMCGNRAEADTVKLFAGKVLYVPYIDPGYILFKEVERLINQFKAANGVEPEVIMLQNHGIFVGADSPERIEEIYEQVLGAIEASVVEPLPEGDVASCSCASEVLPAVRMMVSTGGLKTLKVRSNKLTEFYSANAQNYAKISRPFSPDGIVYCKSSFLYIKADSPQGLVDDANNQIKAYIAKNGYAPKILLIKSIGLVAAGETAAECETLLDVFEDSMKIAWLAQSFGGEHPMTQEQIDFIDNWEVETYRRKVAAVASSGRAENKIIIVTGAAQGFGEGIARCLVAQGANIVVADMNEEVGRKTVAELNKLAGRNRVVFVKVNVAEIPSIENLIHQTVCEFGGLDVFISNAGVLRAGGLEEMTPENFDFVTKINYNAYFYCTKIASRVMKVQNKYCSENYGDVIQINSKSGLRGSKANFAYAGGKFGGIGLTQSFALELAPFRVKVNSICPGNFYEGPLWSDPENGLFVQYLAAGKVPGAKTIDDVRAFYMAQVPMGKGCSPEDVTKAVLYLVEQTCETGQAIPITGGQVMLS